MKNHRAPRNVFITASLCSALLASIFSVIGLGNRSAQAQDTDPNDFIAIRDALRRGGLKEAAKLKGHYVGQYDPHWCFGLFGIESLTKNSAAVIVGRVIKKLGTRLVGDEELLIVTDYEVRVEETLKGSAVQGNTITISLPGGHVDFGDGTSAELTTPTFEHVKRGCVYALFLTDDSHKPDSYTLVGGPQGVVEFASDARVKSRGRSIDPIASETKDRTRESFLKEVREQVRKWPGPGKCCS